MTMLSLILLGLMAILVMASILVFYLYIRARQHEQVLRVLDSPHRGWGTHAGDEENELAATDDDRSAYWTFASSLPLATELRHSLREAGYAGTKPRLIFAFINLALPVAVIVSGLLYFGIAGIQTDALFMIAALVIIAFLMPRWILRWLAARRRQALSDEVPIVIQLLLMLMGAGLSIEHALRILRSESCDNAESALLPEFARELDILMSRVDAGGSLADELRVLSSAVSVQELSDLAAVLRQVLRRGGDIRQSLINLAALIEDRRYTHMQEQAGEIAGKMSAVMILFMFPALVLFIAGPGFLAVLEGLRDAAS